MTKLMTKRPENNPEKRKKKSTVTLLNYRTCTSDSFNISEVFLSTETIHKPVFYHWSLSWKIVWNVHVGPVAVPVV